MNRLSQSNREELEGVSRGDIGIHDVNEKKYVLVFRSTAEKHSRGMARASALKTQLPSYPWIVLNPFSLRTESQTPVLHPTSTTDTTPGIRFKTWFRTIWALVLLSG